jgi:PAS domain S-box-containing protein
MRTALLLVIFFYSGLTFGQLQGNQLADSLTRELAQKKEDSNKVNLLDKLSYTYSKFNPKEGISKAFDALELSEKLSWKKGIALANFDLSINYTALSEHTLALDFANKALRIYQETGNRNGVAATMANMALIYLVQSNYPKALEYSFNALKIYEEDYDEKNKTIVLENIGTIYQEQKKFPEAMKYYLAAMQINKEAGNKTGIARNLGNIGTILIYTGSYDSALKYHNAALKVSEENGDKNSIQINLANIANVFLYQHDYLKALEYQKTALAISEELGHKSSIAINLGNIGETYLAMASDVASVRQNKMIYLTHAIQYLKQAIGLCSEINYSAPQLEFTNCLKDAYVLAGDYRSALGVYQQYTRLKDSVFSNQNKLQIASLESGREVEIKSRDLKLKGRELYISKLELDRERRERFIYIIGILLFALVFGFIVKRLIDTRLSNKQLELDKRIAESKLVDSEFRLKQAQEMAHFGNWAMADLSTGVAIWSEELCRIYGLPVDENQQSYNTWLSFIHPDDLGYVLNIINTARGANENVAFQHRIIKGDGTISYIYSQAFYEFNQDGKPVSMYGVAHDITEAKQNEMEIIKQNDRYNLINKATREAIMDWDIVNDTTVFGEGFTEIFGYQPSQMHPDLMSENIHPDDKDEIWNKLQQILKNPEEDIFETEFRFLRANREIAYVLYKGIFIRDEDKKPIRAISAIMDITDMVERNQALEKQKVALQEIAWIQSHVIRAPLANLMSLVELLQHKEDYNLDEKDILDKIQTAAENLDEVIRDIIKKTEK